MIVEMEQQCAAIYSVLRRHAQETPGAYAAAARLCILPMPGELGRSGFAAACPNARTSHPVCLLCPPLSSNPVAASPLLMTAGFKVIVFFTTARFTQYMAALVAAAGMPVLEIHSRKSQVRVGRV